MGISRGQRTFNFAIKTPKENADAVEAVLRDHAEFMREHHSLDDSKIHLDHYYVSKAEEQVDPMDPAKGTTGNVLYSINEVYMHAEGIGQHMEKATTAWEGFNAFLETLTRYGTVLILNGEVIETLEVEGPVEQAT